MMGVGRLVMTPDRDSAEFAGIVADPWHGKGLGEKLIEDHEHCQGLRRQTPLGRDPGH